MENMAQNPAVRVAQSSMNGATSEIYTTKTGYRLVLKPFPSLLVQRAVSQVPTPKMPVYMNDEKGREEPNPHDPEYRQALIQAAEQRGIVGIDCTLLFGVELIDPIPEDDRWVRKLQFLGVQVSDDPIERELAFLKYVVFAHQDDISYVMDESRVSGKKVTAAEETFPGDEAGSADSGVPIDPGLELGDLVRQ